MGSTKKASRGGKPALSDDQVERVVKAMHELLKRPEYRYHGRPNVAALARGLSRSGPTVWSIIEGQQRPSFQTAVRVAELLGVDPWELVDGRPSNGRMPRICDHSDWKSTLDAAKKAYTYIDDSLWSRVGALKLDPAPKRLTSEMLEGLARVIAQAQA